MISSFEARALVHATEDRERVLKALLSILPEGIRANARVESDVLEGHYGNPIELLSLRLSDPVIAAECLRFLISRMSELEREELRRTIGERVDERGELYLRLNKQSAYLSVISLDDSDDVIRVRISFSGKRGEALRQYLAVIEASRIS